MGSVPGFLTALAVLVAAGLAANPPAIQWQRTFSALDHASGYWVEPTHDGGFVAAGHSGVSTESFRYYLVKTDSLGNLVWERTFGKSDGLCVRQTSDGGYVLAGFGGDTTSGASNDLTQPYVVKTDASGRLEWQRVYYCDTLEYGYCITETLDRGYALLGSNPGADSGLCVFKLDSSGAVEWQRVYPGTGHWREPRSIEQAPDSGFIIGDLTLTKLQASGALLWSRGYDHVGQAMSAQPTHDGGYVATGPGYFTQNPGCSSNVYLLKTDGAGNLEWRRTLGGRGPDMGYSVKQTPDHGYVVAADLYLGQGDAYGDVIRTDSLGDTLWTLSLSTTAWSEVRSVCLAPDGGYVVAGTAPDSASGVQRLCLWKLAPEGR
jgi:hypothetical protein